mmetsp:Transcript_23327/g.51015  ORF Transcript_23327/g.51015 Transcript_23327/m.51015 type:complete len:207 (+) Transcript_23327:326-946(+)
MGHKISHHLPEPERAAVVCIRVLVRVWRGKIKPIVVVAVVVVVVVIVFVVKDPGIATVIRYCYCRLGITTAGCCCFDVVVVVVLVDVVLVTGVGADAAVGGCSGRGGSPTAVIVSSTIAVAVAVAIAVVPVPAVDKALSHQHQQGRDHRQHHQVHPKGAQVRHVKEGQADFGDHQGCQDPHQIPADKKGDPLALGHGMVVRHDGSL